MSVSVMFSGSDASSVYMNQPEEDSESPQLYLNFTPTSNSPEKNRRFPKVGR